MGQRHGWLTRAHPCQRSIALHVPGPIGARQPAILERGNGDCHRNSLLGYRVIQLSCLTQRVQSSDCRRNPIQISEKHMQRYLDEFTFRANHRERVNAMFELMVGAL